MCSSASESPVTDDNADVKPARYVWFLHQRSPSIPTVAARDGSKASSAPRLRSVMLRSVNVPMTPTAPAPDVARFSARAIRYVAGGSTATFSARPDELITVADSRLVR